MPAVPDFEETFDRARDGDTAALEQLLQRLRAPLLRRVRLMMGPQARRHAESSDFMQQVFATAIENVDRTAELGEGGLLRWLTTTARHRIQRSVRATRERAFESLSGTMGEGAVPDKEGETPSVVLDKRERLDLLVEALEALKPEHRRVLELRHFEGMSFQAIGVDLQRTESAAQMLHSRAREALSKALGAGRA